MCLVLGVWPCDTQIICLHCQLLYLLSLLRVHMGKLNVHAYSTSVWSYLLLWCIFTELLTEWLTGQCEWLLNLGGSSVPAPHSSSKLRLRLKAPASCWAAPNRLLGSPWCTLLPCSLTARDSSWRRAWLSECRCSITWKKKDTATQYFQSSHLTSKKRSQR